MTAAAAFCPEHRESTTNVGDGAGHGALADAAAPRACRPRLLSGVSL
jgi:hypothetical protein